MTTLYANDPDVHQTYPITAKEGDLSFSPIVKVAGLDDITATWLGSPGATRDLKVPLSTLPAGYVHSLRLIVPGENDIQLGKVLLEGAGSAVFPGNPDNPGGGSGGSLIIVNGGSIDLDNSVTIGTLLGYRLTATSTVEGIELAAGTYVFERDSGYPSGWNYRIVAPASGLPVPDGGGDPDPEEPTETTPQEPLWDDALLQVTFSPIVGVQYTYNGSPVAAGVYSMSPGATVTASAAPKAGYVFPGGVATSWNHNVPASEDWAPAFTDALTTPTGEVTTRTHWTINNPNAAENHIVISSAGMTVTGTANAQVSPLINGTKHAVEFDYALPVGSYNSTGGGFEIYVAFNDWGGHTIKVYPNDGVNQGSSVVFSGTTGWTGAVGEVGVNLNAQPLVGHIRAEFDGTYVRFLIDDVLILNALPDPNNNPGFGGAARFCSVRLSGAPNTTDIRRIKNLVVETK